MRALLLLYSLVLCACTTATDSIERYAQERGWQRDVLQGEAFRHVVFHHAPNAANDVLHVYIEGDGRPWTAGGMLPSADPTPQRPLALHLMALDPENSLYLGRPCYFGLASDSGCAGSPWTQERYSHAVVTSMAAALNKHILRYGIQKVLLIGYSGGGALAVLMPPYLQAQTELLTVAANLDTDEWTTKHGYLPLKGSLNPMHSAQLKDIRHTHLIGADDRNVSPETTRRFSLNHGGRFIPVPDIDHSCCWTSQWPAILARHFALSASTIDTADNDYESGR